MNMNGPSRNSLLFLLSSVVTASAQLFNPSGYVNPFIGTGGHGHTFPGAVTPFGMVQLSPDTRIDGSWDGCSGYHYSDSVIYGFSHTHLSGTGCSDWGDVMFMPYSGKVSPEKSVYSSKFSHKDEKAEAGYYSVKLQDDNILAELTASTRVGFHKYTFSTGKEKHVIFDMTHRDKALNGSYIRIVSNTKIEGFRRSEAWAKDQYIYFAAEFSEPFAWEIFMGSMGMGDQMLKDNYYSGTNVKAVFTFKNSNKQVPVSVKVSISAVGTDGAWKNMQTEVPHWDFDKVRADAKSLWNKELSKIEVTSGNKDRLAVFYTALYHCMIHPSIYSDVDGRYRGMDNKIYTTDGFNYYTVFSLWDTFRALHPLLTIIDRKRTLDFVKTFLEMYKQTGRLPVWELSGNETDCMIGYHAVSVITDAYVKGITDFDTELALKAMIDMSNLRGYRGLDAYAANGYLQIEDENESVSKTLEYAYNDWCIARFAEAIGKSDVKSKYDIRAQSWTNLFDPSTGFMRPRTNGGWLIPFDPKRVDNNFTEANSWQYSFFVLHDVGGLMGNGSGNTLRNMKKFETKLDTLFTTDTRTTGREQADITGLIGQYAQGNEPSHHMIYLYNSVSQPWKAQRLLGKVMSEFYTNSPAGLIGNEDCGQMSAWFVLGALGFYPLCPGSMNYELGIPLFEKSRVYLGSGKSFTISATNFNDNNTFVSNYSVGSTKGIQYLISQWDIMNEKELVFEMSNQANKSFLSPRSYVSGESIISAPSIKAYGQKVFRDSMKIEISNADTSLRIYYKTDNNLSKPPLKYAKPFRINKSMQLTAYAETKDGKKASNIATANYFLHPHPEWKINILSKYNSQYTAGGDDGIIDGLSGDKEWRKGGWQGYQGQDFECIIDLGAMTSVYEAKLSFLQDTRSWIFFPKDLLVQTSEDGKIWSEPKSIPVPFPAKENLDVTIETLGIGNFIFKKTRYFKFTARNYGKLPEWHPGAGGDTFIFIDEIIIK